MGTSSFFLPVPIPRPSGSDCHSSVLQQTGQGRTLSPSPVLCQARRDVSCAQLCRQGAHLCRKGASSTAGRGAETSLRCPSAGQELQQCTPFKQGHLQVEDKETSTANEKFLSIHPALFIEKSLESAFTTAIL